MNCPVCKEINTKFFEQINGKDYFRCQICHAIFIDDRHRLAPADEGERYAQHNNDIYDKNYRKFLSRLYDPLVKKLIKGSTGLDYGCGPGPALAEMF